jgi:RNA polymerase sigma factor (sigma-70 family)
MDSVDVYEVLVKQHESMLFAYLLSWVKDPGLAEDIAQESFIVGFKKLATLEKKECFAAWLRTIARNLALQELRKRQREVLADEAIIQGLEDIFRPFDQVEAEESWSERVRVLQECLDRLPGKLREACRLHYYDTQSAQQIADRMRVGLEAVKKRLERARDGIRECIERQLRLGEA